jgi:hypothetical protein
LEFSTICYEFHKSAASNTCNKRKVYTEVPLGYYFIESQALQKPPWKFVSSNPRSSSPVREGTEELTGLIRRRRSPAVRVERWGDTTTSKRTCGQLESARGKLWRWLDGDRAAGDGEEWREGYSSGQKGQRRSPRGGSWKQVFHGGQNAAAMENSGSSSGSRCNALGIKLMGRRAS